ncbi:PQQ-binding-like beta-propeller repeat protein [Thermosulfurimonas sp. F29]|uniref:outer membrane protein assembly factor BamB family protein n=1 Tax=Thermosulfurimonas sp. F29 TaxID=2867247 RepID=UPI001C8298A6|nr:PQQ-binding-like beta-propeller repeat protein [Thermosulfurimonas sp. F29]MBX6423252.1 PQQ-binding-like beta-propeller repeat protein [Thermosulfurimonas sp. F29]
MLLLTGPVRGEGREAFGLRLLWDYPLGEAGFYVRAGHSPDAHLAFSPDGRLLALGTFDGRLLLFDTRNGKVLLRRKIPEAMVKRVAFSSEGRMLYYGLQGPEGRICALALSGKKTFWCRSTAGDLLRGQPPAPGDIYGIYRLPGIYRLKVLPDGSLLVLALHSWYDRKVRAWRRRSRLYHLSPQGELLWAYPPRGPAPVTLIYADSSLSGETVAVVSLLPSEAPEDKDLEGPPPQSLIILSGRDGRELWRYSLKPLRPYFDRVAAWESVAVSAGGRFVALGLSDGRLFIFDLAEKRIRLVSLATPIILGGLPVAATVGYGLFGPEGDLYVVTGESTLPYGMPLSVDRPAGPHPAARTLWAIDPATGRIIWRFISPLRLQGLAISRNGRTLAVATGAFRRAGVRIHQFGVLVFDLHRSGGGLERLSGYFPTSGNCFFHLAVSPDGNLVAAVETPWRDDKDRLRGSYRVIMLRITK